MKTEKWDTLLILFGYLYQHNIIDDYNGFISWCDPWNIQYFDRIYMQVWSMLVVFMLHFHLFVDSNAPFTHILSRDFDDKWRFFPPSCFGERWFTTWRPGDVYMRQRNRSSLDRVMAWRQTTVNWTPWIFSAHFVNAPSQCNVVSHWLGAYKKRSLNIESKYVSF